MALGPRLDLRQSQSLVMTPQLQQAIKLLQMSNVELSEYIEQEIEQNPLLEREGTEGGLESEAGEAVAEVAAGEAVTPEGGDAGVEAPLGPDDPGFDDFDTLPDSADHAVSESMGGGDDAALDADYENVYEPESASDASGEAEPEALMWTASGGGGGFDEDMSGLENFAAEATTLREHLASQINIDFTDPAEKVIAGRLMDMLDANGWLSGELETVAVALGCGIERVRAALQRCQQLDPPGIFACSLAECLAIQLREKDQLEIVDQRLHRRLCGVDNEDLLQMIAEIKELNPRPASAFDHEIIQPVVPDVFVRRTAEGWIVELNADTMPRVLVNSRYYAVVRRHARSKADKEYLSDRFQSANWLVRALHQRADTILKVATELVAQQAAFFEGGVEFLRPLTLRDVAEVVGVHESTVSRVTANKYLGMSRGIFELKYFFNSAIGQNDDGESRSAESIRFRIRSLIDQEPPGAVLSDDRIVEILREEGVDIARRTVAKYRDAMRIPSSVQRRREKALHV